MRRLCIGLRSNITICDPCASDFGPKLCMFIKKSPFSTPVHRIEDQEPRKNSPKSHRLRRLCSGLRSKITICDPCTSDSGPKLFAFMQKSHRLRRLCIGLRTRSRKNLAKMSPFATPVHRIEVQNHHLRPLCIGFWSKMMHFHETVTVCAACASD